MVAAVASLPLASQSAHSLSCTIGNEGGQTKDVTDKRTLIASDLAHAGVTSVAPVRHALSSGTLSSVTIQDRPTREVSDEDIALLQIPLSLTTSYISNGVDAVDALLAEARLLLSRGHPYEAEQMVFEAGRTEVVGARGLAYVREALRREWERGVHFEIPLAGSMERQELPGRGVGYVALRHIPAATTIMFDTAFWSTELHSPLEELPDDAAVRENWCLCEGRDDPARLTRLQDVLTMAGAREARKAHPNCALIELLRRVQACNAVEYAQGKSALFPEFSRLNHSCQPNCTWHADALRMYVRTVVDVAPGEELCVSYIMDGVDVQRRSRWLLDSWGFHCTCPLCMDIN
eukprot:gnl/MRDRNA2_/MRDRNA2_56652_c0_seq1.p1 gnl/MRDRNA2_/MRDRNA2_56652_c0~~gnl/MRDRNA2_/MRDRNA2_56652_c0_seq1.p1  ORF type:complete len:348 (+),score=47.11 gnl/MRDRNA2_/MRDRNA2_56652_c0_seq1:45-1088(+)